MTGAVKQPVVRPVVKERCYVCASKRRVVDGLCDRCRKTEQEKETYGSEN